MKINIKGIEIRGRAVLLALLAVSGLWANLSAQQVIINSNGDRIIMYPDGSWRPLAPQDSLLLQQYLKKTAAQDPELTSSSAYPERNKGEEQDFQLRRCQEICLLVFTQEKKVQNEFRAATNAQFKASEMLRNAEANKAVLEADRLTSLKIAYENSVEQLRKAKLNQKEIKKLAGNAQALSNNPEKITNRKLDQLQSRFKLYINHFEPKAISPTPIAERPKNEVTSQKAAVPGEKKSNQKATTGSSANSNKPLKEDLIPPASKTPPKTKTYTRQPYICTPILDSLDEATGRRHVALSPAVIFTHTDPDLRPFLKDRDLITCQGRLWKIGAYVYLNLDFHISSSHSLQNFGSLAKGSLLRLKLLNEDFVSLYNLKTDRGRIDPYTGNTVFSGQYALGKEEIKAFRKNEIDKMRILWGTGYEDYDVYHVDFFMDQLDCLLSR